MIGSAARNFLHPATKFAEGHNHHALEIALGLEIGNESLEASAQFTQQTFMGLGLVDVGVVSSLRNVKDTR